MICSETRNPIDVLPSPVAGMSISNWLGKARAVEHELESALQRGDLTSPQRAKVGGLLVKIRSSLAQQLDRLNTRTAQRPSKP